MATADQDRVYEAIKALPAPERLRLVERVIHDLADAARMEGEPAHAAATSLIGLWADEPDVVDEMVKGILHGREQRPLRMNGDAKHAVDDDG
ncbi:MAG: hypothetical protein EXR72_23990 [Myxococcales bacterium]|nr:hypothetical protein [Myxococcales bacterium]